MIETVLLQLFGMALVLIYFFGSIILTLAAVWYSDLHVIIKVALTFHNIMAAYAVYGFGKLINQRKQR